MHKSENDSNRDGNRHGLQPGGDPGVFSAPLGPLPGGRLLFASGVPGLRLSADAGLADLFRAHFEGDIPRVWIDDGVVTVKYRHLPLLGHLINWRSPPGRLRLNGSIPWDIELRGGVSNLNADLSQLQLGSLDILGGASRMRLLLSKPAGTTFIYISGGVSQGALHAPPGVAFRVQIGGGATRLAFDGQRFGAIGGETALQTADFENAVSRYDICIAGGATNLTVEHKGG